MEKPGYILFKAGLQSFQSTKVNIIAWLEIELAYYDVRVHNVNHYVEETIMFMNN